MNKKNVIIFTVIIVVISVSVFQIYQTPQKPQIINMPLDFDPGGQRVDQQFSVFGVYSYTEYQNRVDNSYYFMWVEKIPDYDYSQIEAKSQNTVFIIPIFTDAAYFVDGFYDYYEMKCDESCLTTELRNDSPLGYQSSRNTVQVLSLLGYNYVTDVDVANNPDILKRYDKVIVLHNEYVTTEEFDAITKHPKVMYLYPNSLYAEIQYDKENNTISLIRGHHYPENSISNGFNWKFDNSSFEYDTKCENWGFYEIDNGKMLNCYPENKIIDDFSLLKEIRDY